MDRAVYTDFHLSRLVALLEIVLLRLQAGDEVQQFLGLVGQPRRVGAVNVQRANSLLEDRTFLLLQTLLRLATLLVRLKQSARQSARLFATLNANARN